MLGPGNVSMVKTRSETGVSASDPLRFTVVSSPMPAKTVNVTGSAFGQGVDHDRDGRRVAGQGPADPGVSQVIGRDSQRGRPVEVGGGPEGQAVQGRVDGLECPLDADGGRVVARAV